MRRVMFVLSLLVLLGVMLAAALPVIDFAIRIRNAHCFDNETTSTLYYGCSFRVIK